MINTSLLDKCDAHSVFDTSNKLNKQLQLQFENVQHKHITYYDVLKKNTNTNSLGT